MKKYLSTLAIVLGLVCVPAFVFADDGPRYSCLNEKLSVEEQNKIKEREPVGYFDRNDGVFVDFEDVYNKVRGTCKMVGVTYDVSVDPAIQKDYILARHAPIYLYLQLPDGFDIFSNYSETIEFNSEKSFEYSTGQDYNINSYPILLDKEYVDRYLNTVYKKSNLGVVDYNKLPRIVLLSKDELKVPTDTNYAGKPAKYTSDDFNNFIKGKDDPIYSEVSFDEYSGPSIYSFSYKDFGKHIYAIKGEGYLKESNYVASSTLLPVPLKDGVERQWFSHGNYSPSDAFNIVSVTSPIKAKKEYWVFTKENHKGNNKLILAWQKTEYTLDDGSIRTVLSTDKNVNIATLFGKLSSNSATSVPQVLQASSTSVTEQSIGKSNLITRFLNMVRSWFK